jgi:hypothetical protein
MAERTYYVRPYTVSGVGSWSPALRGQPKPKRAIHTIARCPALYEGWGLTRTLLPTVEIDGPTRLRLIADGRWWDCRRCRR